MLPKRPGDKTERQPLNRVKAQYRVSFGPQPLAVSGAEIQDLGTET
jgi:hypothetical protein